ncbi:hypothetical protein V3471_14760 [Flavobacterium oreochromis]|uniref:hypothetical protein n=1 Tax=Flavobacterium oreochromis TaxID=2906078 RepID=UPI00385A3C6F
MIGNNLHEILKKNNTAVWAVMATALIISIVSLFFAFSAINNSKNSIYAINSTGEVVPLTKLEDKKDRIKQLKSNMDYFVSLYFDLDGYTMKEKKEKILWLVGDKPTKIIKDRDRKGYFNDFLSYTGLVQHAEINQKSWKINSVDSPYNLSFSVTIVRINGEVKEFYNCDIKATVEEVNRNYPYNPHGFLITNFSEELKKLQMEDVYKEDKSNIQNLNQNGGDEQK